MDFSKKEMRTVLFAVTLGNLLEWYEIYLFIYWAPIIASQFFHDGSQILDLTQAFLVIAVGFLARPLGGIFFGRLGDRIGRRKALIISLTVMTIPTFIMGFLPTYAQIGAWAPIILGIMRFLQAFPAGGELPGASCYLYESAPLEKRRFVTSWASLGFQLGILISTLECLLLEHILPPYALITWGWRVSFLFGGVIGLSGLFLRLRLHETPLYKEMLTHLTITKEPIWQVLNKYKKKILLIMMFGAINSSAFYLITIDISGYFAQIFHWTYSQSLILNCFFLSLLTIPLPLFGKLGDKYNNQAIMITAVLCILILLHPMSFAIQYQWPKLLMGTTIVFCLCITCLSALLPYMISSPFPTHERFTCSALGFNLTDALIGGGTPAAVLILTQKTGNPAAFCWLLFICAIISLVSYLLMGKEKHSHTNEHPKKQ